VAAGGVFMPKIKFKGHSEAVTERSFRTSKRIHKRNKKFVFGHFSNKASNIFQNTKAYVLLCTQEVN
jgi:hypothetical protein